MYKKINCKTCRFFTKVHKTRKSIIQIKYGQKKLYTGHAEYDKRSMLEVAGLRGQFTKAAE